MWPRRWWRRKAAQPRAARLYVGRDCVLCDEALQLLQPYRNSGGLSLSEVDIAAEPELLARYRHSIPVLVIESGPTLRWPFSHSDLEHALR